MTTINNIIHEIEDEATRIALNDFQQVKKEIKYFK